jgi:cytochrome b
LTLQLLTGLMSTDDIMTDGPLVPYISSDWVSIATEIHEINFFVMLGFVVLHVLAIVIYRLKGKDLISPMLTGKSKQHQGDAGQFKPVWQAFVIFLVLLGVLMLTWGQDPIAMI